MGNVYSYVMEHNKSYANPYHNNFHLEHVCLFALKGCEFYKIQDQYKKLIATAALFHDFNHTGSGKNDDDNILIAVQGFLDFNVDTNMFVDDEEKIIVDLIKTTRYPYLNDCSELSLFEKIIRDSDIIQGPFCQNYINGVVYGIAKENNIPLSKMLDGQISFLSSTKFCTDWATSLYNDVLPSIIDKVEKAKSLV